MEKSYTHKQKEVSYKQTFQKVFFFFQTFFRKKESWNECLKKVLSSIRML